MIQRAAILVNKPEDTSGSEAATPGTAPGTPAGSGRDKKQ